LVGLLHGFTLDVLTKARPIPVVLPNVLKILRGEKLDLIPLLRRLGYQCTLENLPQFGEVQKFTHDTTAPFILNAEAKPFLTSFKEPFCVLAITGILYFKDILIDSGPLRSGKSTLVSLILKHINGQKRSFEVGNTRLCCTVGIWVWPELLEYKGKKILLLDIEGLYGGDPLTGNTDEYFMKLFTLASMMSSMLFYNQNLTVLGTSTQQIGELQKLMHVGKLIEGQEKRQVAVNKYAVFMSILPFSPHFVFIGRNYNNPQKQGEDQEEWKEFLEQRYGPFL
jgi:hypothetical protein